MTTTSPTFEGVRVTDLASPRAARLAVPRWLDARLVLGVLLIALSIAAGARVFTAADNLTAVYVAAHDLVPGEHVGADDLAVGHVRLRGTAGSSRSRCSPGISLTTSPAVRWSTST